jgi:hypothetical protein
MSQETVEVVRRMFAAFADPVVQKRRMPSYPRGECLRI